jgi:hypothetical protein
LVAINHALAQPSLTLSVPQKSTVTKSRMASIANNIQALALQPKARSPTLCAAADDVPFPTLEDAVEPGSPLALTVADPLFPVTHLSKVASH